MMGDLNSFSASGGGNLNKNFPKIQMPGGCPGGMLKLRFDWYISSITPHGATYTRASFPSKALKIDSKTRLLVHQVTVNV